jgi:hypothetical protein
MPSNQNLVHRTCVRIGRVCRRVEALATCPLKREPERTPGQSQRGTVIDQKLLRSESPRRASEAFDVYGVAKGVVVD